MGKASLNLTRNRTRLHPGHLEKLSLGANRGQASARNRKGNEAELFAGNFVVPDKYELFFEVGDAPKKTEFENGLAETAKAPRQAADDQ
jgi:hypothetical protein